MTSRTVSSTEPGTPTGPGDRPHLPPVASASTSRRTAHKTPLGWLPWLLLGLLALTLLAAALLARGVSGDGSGAASADRAASAAQGGGSGQTADAPSLTAGGQDLLALEGGRLGSLEGQRAEGTARVESVVADEGFWVGQDARNRVFVFLTPQARRSAGESGFQVEAGQTVSLRGTVKASSAQFAERAGVSADEGAQQLVEQAGYVEATEVRLAE